MTSEEVIAQLGVGAEADDQWASRTVRTFLARLVKANVVGVERRAGQYRYRAAVSWEDHARQEVQSLIDRLFRGRSVALMTYLLEQQAPNRRELEELKRLVLTIELQQGWEVDSSPARPSPT
jgi:predicted transcriptional regulator